MACLGPVAPVRRRSAARRLRRLLRVGTAAFRGGVDEVHTPVHDHLAGTVRRGNPVEFVLLHSIGTAECPHEHQPVQDKTNARNTNRQAGASARSASGRRASRPAQQHKSRGMAQTNRITKPPSRASPMSPATTSTAPSTAGTIHNRPRLVRLGFWVPPSAISPWIGKGVRADSSSRRLQIAFTAKGHCPSWVGPSPAGRPARPGPPVGRPGRRPAELGEHAGDVRLHGRLGDEQPGRDARVDSSSATSPKTSRRRQVSRSSGLAGRLRRAAGPRSWDPPPSRRRTRQTVPLRPAPRAGPSASGPEAVDVSTRGDADGG
jgi:hypothetical protein